MFKTRQPDYALIFKFDKEEKVPLHMFFVFYPIDVLFLDKNKKVVGMKPDFRPWHFHKPDCEAKYIIEAPENTVAKAKIELGDAIDFFED